MKNKIILCLALLGPLWIAACGQPVSPSAAVARDFVEAYYVKADLSRAATFADSLALEKVNLDAKLRDGQKIDSSTHQPNVAFHQIEEQVAGNTATYLYLLSFKPQDASKMEKKTLVRVRQSEGGAWKVTQFSDYDIP